MEASAFISTQIIPVLLLPVTGLLALAFYNRAGGMNQRIRMVQKELRDLLIKGKETGRQEELIDTLRAELEGLHSRSKVLFFSIYCCLLAIVLFSLCAVFITLGIFVHGIGGIAISLWFAGPVLICLGVIGGMIELYRASKTLFIQTSLIDKWGHADDRPL